MQTYLLFINASKLCMLLTQISFSTLKLNRYLYFNMTTPKNSALHKYDVANEINICQALLAISRYSSFMFF